MVGVGAGALVAGVFILLLREYTSMSVDIRNTFEGRLNLVFNECMPFGCGGGPLEVFFPSGRNGFPYVVSVYQCCQLP